MSHTPKLTLIGLYNYDDTLFDKLFLPVGVDKEIAVKTILLSYGEAPLTYPDLDFMKDAIGIWSDKNEWTFWKISQALQAEYNPIHNYDRHEEYTDKESLETSANASQTGSTEDTVSAYNATTYQPDSKSDSTGSTTNAGTSDRELKHSAHLYGNIGVTTSQEMLRAEVELRVNINVYDVIADSFYKEFCLYTY